MYRVLILFLLFTAYCPGSIAAEPPTQPFLRLETGMHTAPISRIAADAQGRWLATASDDKTLRLWDLNSGALLKTFRPPIADGNEGMLYAVAMAPDGDWLATGGWSGYEWDDKHSVYVFVRHSGELLRRLDGLENVILDLCVSPDGRWLGATLGGTNGVRVWDTRTWELVFHDRDYGDQSYACDFAADQRLVTTSYDGDLRLYRPPGDGFELAARNTVPGGERPFGAAFSPDGARIAVGFGDSSEIAVVDGHSLEWLYAPPTDGVDNGTFYGVAWSADGQTLYAGGRYNNYYANSARKWPVLAWSQAGQGAYRVWPAASNTIMDLHTLADGRLLYGTGDPAWGLLRDGEKVLERGTVIADYRNNWDGLRVSSDGSRVEFAFELYGEHPARFDLAAQTLILDPAADPTLAAPDTRSLDITDWNSTYSPKLDGNPLALYQYEISLSLAVAPDASRFVLGTNWYINLYDHNGQFLWQVPAPSATWAVNISGDGQKVLAAFADGTIRWYRITDGQELLALFPHNNGQDWVAWTPSGYYMTSSAEVDNLLGWHLNNGKDRAASFYPVSALRRDYKHPAVLQNILATLDEAEAVRLAGTALATPDVASALTEQAEGYQLRSEPSGLGKVILVAASGEQDRNTLFPFSNRATTDMYRLLWRRGFSDSDILYLNPYPPVVPADGYVDAARQDFTLRQDPYADLENAINQAAAELQAGQQFILYLHGHARREFIRLGPARELSSAELKLLLNRIPAGVQQVLILDTCYSGSFLDDLAGPGRIVVTSSDPDSLAVSHQYGSFSEYFTQVLWHGFPVQEGFREARAEIRSKSEWFGAQDPRLDDDGNGVFEPDKDGDGETYLGDQRYFGDLPPEIVEVHPPLSLAAGQSSATVWLRTLPAADAIRQVRAIFVNEHDGVLEYQGEDTQFTRREFYLQPNPANGRFEFTYQQFHSARSWTILYQAQNMEGAWSDIVQGRVEVGGAAVSLHGGRHHYRAGERLTLDLVETDSAGYDLYLAIILPDGQYLTLSGKPDNPFHAPNTVSPWWGQRGQGEALTVFDLTLPPLPPGQYCFFAVLSPEGEEPFSMAEHWVMDQHCLAVN